MENGAVVNSQVVIISSKVILIPLMLRIRGIFTLQVWKNGKWTRIGTHMESWQLEGEDLANEPSCQAPKWHLKCYSELP